MGRFASVVAVTASTSLLLFVAQPVEATYPGKNGRIAFSLEKASGTQIYSIRPNGKDLRQITSLKGTPGNSDWSPDGSKIVFDVVRPGEEGNGCLLKMMNPDGSHIVDLTPQVLLNNDGCAWNPSFTPNGKRIVFVSQRCASDGECPRRIWTMRVNGGGRRQVLRHWNLFPPGGYDLHAPHVSPDGRTVVFQVVNETFRNGNRKALFTVRMNGTHLTQIVPFRMDTTFGDWKPNGKRIVSSSAAGPTAVPGKAPNLFTVRSDGSDVRFVTHSSNTAVYITVGTYSPNGQWIMYKRISPDEKYWLMKIHPSGKDPTVIRSLPANFVGRDWGPR
jgi:Tol biopolymer transport system component